MTRIHFARLCCGTAQVAALILSALLPAAAPAQTTLAQPGGLPIPPVAQDPTAAAGGPVRLRQAPAEAVPTAAPALAPLATPPVAPVKPGEFEAFVELPRFGMDLVSELATTAADFSPEVPADYLIQTGDEVSLAIWGSVDADLRLTVDRSGRITLPRVGTVMLAGVRYEDLQATISRRVAQVFKGFELSASLGRLRGVRVYVTGFAQRPGSYVVGGLSTVMNAVMKAGGPGMAGSLRQVELRRGGKLVASLDLYDLILRGDRQADRVVQPDDVIHIQAVGPLVAIKGSVNKPAVYELKPGETLKELLRMTGGLSALADRSRLALQRLEDRNSSRVVQVALPQNEALELKGGDILQAFSAVDAALSVERQNRRVRVEGEVARPGEYLLPPGSTLADAVRVAGGLTRSAYLYGAQFSRESVRVAQVENYERALRDLENDIARSSASKRVATAEESANQAAQAAASSRLLERLRAAKPNGRVVLQIASGENSLPELLLEDQDRLSIPAIPSSVGVFGSVFNAGSYLYSAGRSVDEYLRLAGGPTKGADEASVFVVRANGQVVSSRQNSSPFSRGNQIASLFMQPGDTVYVPEELDRSSFLQNARDWTLLLFQLGVGTASLKNALNF